MSAQTSQGRPSDRLRALGVTVPEVAAPVAAYVPAVRSGQWIYTSGQLPLVRGELLATGLVGLSESQVSQEVATEAARASALNAIAAAAALVGDVDRLVRVVKVVGFVASAPGFVNQPQVINGASRLLGEVFDQPHARSAVGVAALPLNAPVEVEVIFEVMAD